MLIDNFADLVDFVSSIDPGETIGVDTEFMRERTYFSSLCLVQIATSTDQACIDVLAIEDLSALQDLLLDDQRLKIFHAARQDLEVLFQRFGSVPGPVFDTQVAAGFCGLGDQVGYANLVEATVGKTLTKDETRTDWSQRPLSRAQLDYALADVLYLHRLHEVLSERLDALDRLGWFHDEMGRLLDPGLYEVAPAQAWRRIGAVAGLAPEFQRRVQKLASWRELVAQGRNLPRAWILKDRALVDLACIEFEAGQDLAAVVDANQIEGMDSRFLDRWGGEIADLLLDPIDDADRPLAVSGRRLSAAENALRKHLMTALRARARQLDVTPSLLGNRADVERLIRDPEGSPLLDGWRNNAIGAELLAIRQQALLTESSDNLSDDN